MIFYYLSYLLLRIFLFPFEFLSWKAISVCGTFLGQTAYYLLPSYRKRTLSNLALASSLAFSPAQIKKTAKKSFCNIMTTCLEYAKLSRMRTLSEIISVENKEGPLQYLSKGIGVIFLCAHQANWELLFIEGSERMKGIAIGRPIKNPYLYRWICSIREQFGGKIIAPKNAIKEGLKALRRGEFIGIVGDQAMPESGFSSPFFGREAFSSPAVALLAYRTASPIFVVTVKRTTAGFNIIYHPPLLADTSLPQEQAVSRIMNDALAILEKSIKETPHEWLWLHNRWKQETPDLLYYRFRHDSILCIIPEGGEKFIGVLKLLFRLYPKAFKTIQHSAKESALFSEFACEKIPFSTPTPPPLYDYRFKLVYDFSSTSSLDHHYRALSAFEVLTPSSLKKVIQKMHKTDPQDSLEQLLLQAIKRKEVPCP